MAEGSLYDARGNLLLQSGPTSTTLYADGGAEQITATGSTLSGLRLFGNSPDGTSVVESSQGTISYQLANQQGTALESIDAATLAITRRYYDPWGNRLGVPPAWPDNHGFLGKVTDPLTGFSLLGPREYEPVVGPSAGVLPPFDGAGKPAEPRAALRRADPRSERTSSPAAVPSVPVGRRAVAHANSQNPGVAAKPTGRFARLYPLCQASRCSTEFASCGTPGTRRRKSPGR